VHNYTGASSKKLEHLCTFFEIPITSALHQADADVRALGAVLEALALKQNDSNEEVLDTLYEYFRLHSFPLLPEDFHTRSYL